MPKLLPVEPKKLIKFFIQRGFSESARSKKHITLRKKGVSRPVVISHGRADVPVDVLKNNLRTANITRDEFITAMQKSKKRK